MGARIGFTVSRALGGAVERNRIRRRTREAVRQHYSLLAGEAVDVVINPRKSVLKADFAVLSQEVARAFAVVRQARQRRNPGLNREAVKDRSGARVKLMKWVAIKLIEIYKRWISPGLPPSCRFGPPVRSMPWRRSTGMESCVAPGWRCCAFRAVTRWEAAAMILFRPASCVAGRNVTSTTLNRAPTNVAGEKALLFHFQLIAPGLRDRRAPKWLELG